MDKTELRIGNAYKDCTFEEVRFITEFSEDGVYFDEGFDWYESILDVPLTEEWLVKFGFELDGKQINGSYYKIEFNYTGGFRDFISISDKGAGYMFSLTSNYDKNSILPFEYKYVHKLQNLYHALTGKELTINTLT